MSASTKKKLRKEQNLAQLTEKQLAEQKEAKKLKITTIVFAVVVLAVLITGLVVMAVGAYNNTGITERNTVALTVGEQELSVAELNYFYMDGINAFYTQWKENYGDYASMYLQFMMGLDMTKPLDEQIYDSEANTTYADYFTDAAVQSAVSAYGAYELAQKEGLGLHDLDKDTIELSMSQIELAAATAGYKNVEGYLKAMYGNGATEESFRKYLEVISVSNHYLQNQFEGFTYTADELEAYSTEHFDEFSSFTYCSFTLQPNAFLLCTAKEGEENHVHTDEENAQALEAAKAAADAILALAPTDAETFNAAIKAQEAYAESETAACSEVKSILLSDVTNEKLAQWLKDPARKAGDLTVLTNETTTTDAEGKETTKVNNYTVVLMQERNDNNMELVNIRHILQSYEGGQTDPNGNQVYSDAEKKAAMDAIKLLEENFKTSGATEELFADLAKTNSTDPGSASNGGLYEDVYPGQMVPSFNDWCFDPARQAGDVGIVESDYGVHLMYFVGTTGTTYRNFMIENLLRNEDYNEMMENINETTPYTVGNTGKLSQDLIMSSMFA